MHNDNQEWTHTAMRAALDECDSTPYKMMGFAILGLVAASLNPFAAAVLGLGGIIWCQKKEFDSCHRSEFAALHNGAGVAAKGQMLKEYVADVGRENVVSQLLCAARLGYPVNQDGWELLDDHYGEEKLNELLDEKIEGDVGFQIFNPVVKMGSVAMLKSAEAPPESLTAAVSLPSDGLKDRLKIDCPELLLLVKGKPIRVAAEQRTGKSSFVRKLVLIRQLLIPDHQVTWCTPHLEKDDRLPVELNPIGYTASGGKDMAAIEACWIATQKDINAGKQLNQTVVWDEFGDYAEFEKPDVLAQSLLSLLRESKKKEYYPILITHGDQAAFYPGVKNILTTLKQGTVKVETVGEVVDDFGSIRPTGKFRVYEQDSENFKELQLPHWLTEEYLLGLLPKLPQPVEAIAQPTQTYPVEYQLPTQIHPVEYQPTVKQKLEDTFKLSSAELTQVNEVEETFDPVDLLREPLNEIGRYIISKGGEVDVRSLKAWGRSRKNGAILSGEIQDYLLEMVEMGLIEIFTHDDRKAEHIKWLTA